jgi:ABC-type transport system involved in multi-copper enzyme maturation permease subunit
VTALTGFAAVVRAEWTKARTVRSTWWSLATAAVLCVGLALLLGLQMSASYERMSADAKAAWDPVQFGFYPLLIGQVALVVFGVLLVSAEYTSGTIRASLAAVPRRGVFLAAKTAVAAAVAGVLAVAVAFGAFFTAQWGLAGHGASLGQPGVLRAVCGAVGYLTLMCVFSMAVATVLRSSALALGILVPVLFLNSQGLSNLPAIRPVTQYLPDQAGAGMMQVVATEETFIGHRDFGPGGALLILLAWVAVALAAAWLSLRRRDA